MTNESHTKTVNRHPSGIFLRERFIFNGCFSARERGVGGSSRAFVPRQIRRHPAARIIRPVFTGKSVSPQENSRERRLRCSTGAISGTVVLTALFLDIADIRESRGTFLLFLFFTQRFRRFCLDVRFITSLSIPSKHSSVAYSGCVRGNR